MAHTTNFSEPCTKAPALCAIIRAYMRDHAADARALMAAFEHEAGFDALATIENELAMPVPDPVVLMASLNELLLLFQTTSVNDLIDHAQYFLGPDILGAWNYHGARISELVSNG